MIGLDHQIRKRGYIRFVYKRIEKVRDSFCCMTKITRQLIFYDLISIVRSVYPNSTSTERGIKKIKRGEHKRKQGQKVVHKNVS